MQSPYPLTLPLLLQVHASTLHLSLMSWQAHWNVVGSNFYQLHQLFGAQYSELAEAVDRIAEHMRVLGVKAPGSLSLIAQISVLEDIQFNNSDKEMLSILLINHQRLADLLDSAIAAATNENLQASANILQDRAEAHGKAIWMLRSNLVS